MAVQWNGDEVMRRIRAGAMQGVMRGTERVHDVGTRKIMDPPKSGKKHPGLPNRSSAPGESPATQHGDLQRSGDTVFDATNLTGTAIWRSDHAMPMELGTEDIEPRPFARPALAENIDAIRDDVADEIAKALR